MELLSKVLLFLTINCIIIQIGAQYQYRDPFREQFENYAKKQKEFYKEEEKKAVDLLSKFDILKIDFSNLKQLIPFFNAYEQQFQKFYPNQLVKELHMGYFRKTMERVQEFNKNSNNTYKQGVNELSDLNYTEIEIQKTGFKVIPETKISTADKDVVVRASESDSEAGGDNTIQASVAVPQIGSSASLPDRWDWRDYGILNTPRNQGKCGSCWSFAAAACLESHNVKRLIANGNFDKNNPVTVSEQNLIDCSGEKFGSLGCDGGMPQQAWKYVAANGGVSNAESYPYKGRKEDCAYNPDNKADVVVTEAKRLKSGQDNELANAIYTYGPVSIAIHVTKDMASYKSGIFDDPTCNPKKVNHAVVAVGYTPDYFIIRNSWGAKWGEDGYIRISRIKVNNCGVSQQGYYPVLPNAVETDQMRDKLKAN